MIQPATRTVLITITRTGEQDALQVSWTGLSILEVFGAIELAKAQVIGSQVKGGINGNSATAESGSEWPSHVE
jgi:hypothetical protein